MDDPSLMITTMLPPPSSSLSLLNPRWDGQAGHCCLPLRHTLFISCIVIITKITTIIIVISMAGTLFLRALISAVVSHWSSALSSLNTFKPILIIIIVIIKVLKPIVIIIFKVLKPIVIIIIVIKKVFTPIIIIIKFLNFKIKSSQVSNPHPLHGHLPGDVNVRLKEKI